jgi:type II secretory pathway pseudopilin PulG
MRQPMKLQRLGNFGTNRTGFTMIEMLVSVGIIVLLGALSLAGILAAKKHANQTRVRDDLALIAMALEAYKSDSNGQYPVFADASTDQAVQTAGLNSNFDWLDYQPDRGAVLLCRALIGPGPAMTNTSTSTVQYPNPGDDGADGPGFRGRHSLSIIQYGKVYGPYLDASKFKIGYLPTPTKYQTFPQAYPVILDTNGNPILYYPAAAGNPASNLGYLDPSSSSLTSNVVSRFNGFDNEYQNPLSQAGTFTYNWVDSLAGGSAYSSNSTFGQLAANCGNLPYLLWTAGSDGAFGLVNGKSDDIANFDLPANLIK